MRLSRTLLLLSQALPSAHAASGYVLSETRRTLVLLSAAGKRARIPKAGAVFELTLRGAPLEVTRECG